MLRMYITYRYAEIVDTEMPGAFILNAEDEFQSYIGR